MLNKVREPVAFLSGGYFKLTKLCVSDMTGALEKIYERISC